MGFILQILLACMMRKSVLFAVIFHISATVVFVENWCHICSWHWSIFVIETVL